jgi:cyanophycinase-like exopeptidase
MRYFLTFIGSILIISGCGASKETCNQYEQMEAAQLASRNTINAMDREHSSDATKSALADADDALDILEAKMMKECPNN